MAVALFRDLRTLPHRDLGNQQGTCNLVAGLSGFRAGGAWVSSDSGAVPCPFGNRAVSTNLYFREKNFRIFVMRKFRLAVLAHPEGRE